MNRMQWVQTVCQLYDFNSLVSSTACVEDDTCGENYKNNEGEQRERLFYSPGIPHLFDNRLNDFGSEFVQFKNQPGIHILIRDHADYGTT